MTKIVIVHWKGGLTRWYPYSLNTLEELAASCSTIEMIEILDCGLKDFKVIKGGSND